MTGEPEDPLTRTGVLRAHFGEQYRFWLWLRSQFTPTSLGVIGSVLVGSAGYIGHLRETVSAVTTRVLVLETRVIPVIDQSNKTAALQVALDDTRARVDRLEHYWDNAGKIVSTPDGELLRQKRRSR